MQPPTRNAKPEDIDVAALCRAFWRAEMWIISLSILAGLVTFVGLSMMRPLYTSEARVLIENDNSPFTHTATDQGRDQLQVLDEQAVQSQIKVITSRDLVLEVVRSLDLINSPEFAKDAGVSYLQRLLNRFGLGRGSAKSEQEKAADAFIEHLSVYALNKSSARSLSRIRSQFVRSSRCLSVRFLPRPIAGAVAQPIRLQPPIS
jgi:uncharacterized protein involved in exopolysaccharide biosynthesis